MPTHDEQFRNAWRWYALSLSLFLAALKQNGRGLAAGRDLGDHWWKRGRLPARDVARSSLFSRSGSALGFVTAWMEKHFVGAAGVEWGYSPVEACVNCGRAVWFYAAKLAWPYPLAFFYPRFTIDEHPPWQYCFPRRPWYCRRAVGDARSRRPWPARGCADFWRRACASVGLRRCLSDAFSFVADHFQYHASIGSVALAAAIAATFIRNCRGTRRPDRIGGRHGGD